MRRILANQSDPKPDLHRRGCLIGAAALAMGWHLPALAREAQARGKRRYLVLVQLDGANDGLSMVAPWRDPAYRGLRPTLALGRDRVLPLNEQLGLNDRMSALMAGWQADELAVCLGVGYPQPNRSHFTSTDIWETAGDGQQLGPSGWLAQAFADGSPHPSDVTHGLVLDRAEGPFRGGHNVLAVDDVRRLLARGEARAAAPSTPAIATTAASGGNPALEHLLQVDARTSRAAAQLAPYLLGASPMRGAQRLPASLDIAARLIEAGAPLSVIKVAQGGYDTHSNQASTHNKLMQTLADALGEFRARMIKAGTWRQTLVMTYSEFGRRAGENASKGTDHGTSAPHLLLGGRVRGGLYGQQPSLGELEGGDLRFVLDYRRLYATVLHEWWNLPVRRSNIAMHKGLGAIA